MPRSAKAKIALCLVLALPAIVLRSGGFHPAPVVSLVVFGVAVVAAAFLLAWAAEAAQKDISGALAIAILALIAVLPEYAIDLYYAFRSGSDPQYEQYAAANMTGSNRLLLGFGWPLVVLIAIGVAAAATRRVAAGNQRSSDQHAIEAVSGSGFTGRALVLGRGLRLDVGFLAILSIIAFLIPALGYIPIWFGVVLVLLFVVYLWQAGRASNDDDGEELVGMAGHIGDLPQRARRSTVIGLFVAAAAIILFSAKPFADALVESGTSLGIDSFFLVQWLAPLASEAPEFIVAILFAVRGLGPAAIATLIASKVNQWSLLVGSLPVAHFLGGGGAGLDLDSRQIEEFVLTASQALMGVAIILALRFHRWSAIALALLFAVQFFVTDTHGRYWLSGIHLAIAAVALIVYRREIIPTLAAPFRTRPVSEGAEVWNRPAAEPPARAAC